jgi:hypothetical protein
VPADAVEQVYELARVSEEEVAVFGCVLREPADGGFVVEDGLVLADQEEQRERVSEADRLEFCCGVEGEVGVPALESALEPGVSASLRGHQEHMFAYTAR